SAAFNPGYLDFYNATDSLDIMALKYDGKVGIGSPSPASLLDVFGTAQLRGSQGGTGLYVNSAGKVGIGTQGPTESLDVAGGAVRIRGTGTTPVASTMLLDASGGG